ncbi:MAG TPA: cellulase family glycosylhydrolase [Xanthobacteraceae bacterium]|jgi:endoglucanase|nr:cellulase family glycosylhydrolase [Xanthobacteraceae bacterium]
MIAQLGRWLARCVQLGITLALFLANEGNAATLGDFIRADGKYLVGGNGERFAIKGTNLGNWLVPEGYMFKFTRARAPSEIDAVIRGLIGPQDTTRFWKEFRDVYVAKADIDFIKAAGFNTVRVPLHWGLFVKPGPRGEDQIEGPGWALLDRLVGWSREAGLRVILDLHAAPGGQTGVNHDDGPGFPLVFYVPRYRELTIELWRRLALHYRDEPTVLAYDLLNEPISPYNDEAYLNPRLEPLYREIVAAIRSADSTHPVILAGAQWSTSFAAFSRPFDDNAIYSYHKFWAVPARDAVQSYLDFSNRWNVPLLIGETGEGSYQWNEKFRLLNEKFGIGWCFWPYKNLNSQTSVVSIREPAEWNLIARAGGAATSTALNAALPREQALTILNAYLEAARFANVKINKGYLVSLGLSVP